MSAIDQLREILDERIVVHDGAWGVLIHRRGLSEEDYRGELLRDHPRDVQGDPDLLNLTRPEIVSEIHDAYFAAGADLATTNTFTATSIGQGDYALEGLAAEMSLAGARLARAAADEWTKRTPERPRFVAGALGPLNVSLSVSPKVEDAAFRSVTFDEVARDVRGADRGARRGRRRPPPRRDDLRHAEREGGDRRRARGGARFAALALVHRDRQERPEPLGADGRGVLGLGRARTAADRRRQLLARRDRDAPVPRRALPRGRHVCLVLPERGAPNAMGEHDEQPADTSRYLARIRRGRARERRRGLLRHDTRAHSPDRRRRGGDPHAARPRHAPATRWSGLEPFEIGPDTGFVMIGERTNVTGSARFRSLVESGDLEEAVEIALEQVRSGANALDVNMDADLLDGEQVMTRFLNLLATEPEAARLPIVVDSSRWSVLEAGLKCLQGKGIVNSLSLKEGEETFLEHARRVRGYGAGVVVMAFDEQGQADTVARKVEICERAYRLLIERPGSRPRTSSSTRTSSPSRPGSKSTTSSRRRSSSRCR